MKMKFISKPISKKLIVSILILTLFSGLFLINIGKARASYWDWVGPGPFIKLGEAIGEIGPIKTLLQGAAKEMLEGMAQLLWKGAAGALALCASLFTSTLDHTTEILSGAPVYAGWKITRDIVNMFFILALVVIAFATILRIETYGIKALLPKLIIMALLINFSFLACGIIIDISNVTANFFAEAIKSQDNPTNKIGVGGQIQAAIITPPSSDKEIKMGHIDDDVDIVLAELTQALVMFIAAFILLIGAVLLVIRMGALWLLIILAPFAWFFSIFPILKGMNSKWWSNFFKYAFFAPIYLFFIYIGLSIIKKIGLHAIDINASESSKEMVKLYTNYLIAVIIFGGAPIAAMSMGVYGSKAVIGGAKGVFSGTAKGIGRWTGKRAGAGARRVFRPEKIAGGIANLPKILSIIPGVKALGRATGRWAAGGTTRINEEAKKLPTLPEKETANRFKLTTDPYQKMAWLQKLSGVAKDPANVSLVGKNLKKYEAMGGNVVKDIIANDLTLARTDTERTAAATIRRSTGKTTLKENEAKNIESVEAMRTALGTDEFTKAVNKMPDAIKDAIGDTLIDAANKSPTPITGTSLEQRKVFAKITGRIAVAFQDNNKNLYNKQLDDYVRKMKPEAFGKIKDNFNLRIIANSTDVSTALNIRKYLSREMANVMGRNFAPGVKKALKQSPAWASNIS